MSALQLVSALVIVAAGLGPPLQDAGRSRGKVRTIQRPQGVSIRSLLRPSDEIVVVGEGGITGPPLTIAFANNREAEEFELELLSRRNSALLLVRVEAVDAALDATESWITSTARMKIVETLSAGDAPLDGTWGDATIDTKNGDMTWHFDGGEMRFGKTLVSAGDFLVWEPKATYLISLLIVTDKKAAYMPVMYQVGKNGRLVPRRLSRGRSMRALTALQGRRLSDVRKLIARPQPSPQHQQSKNTSQDRHRTAAP